MVQDLSDTSYHAKGKQKLKRGGMYYTAQSGIWQTVWMEYVPQDRIKNVETKYIKTGKQKTFNYSLRDNLNVDFLKYFFKLIITKQVTVWILSLIAFVDLQDLMKGMRNFSMV